MEPQAIELRDGRRLSYAIYGDPNGIPVVYFHGIPGSRLLPRDHNALAQQRGIRLIVPERPGFGLSDFQPNRQLLDWPDDVIELADALDIDRFGIIGPSGGGPYAAACAYKIPERLTKVALVCSLAPYDALREPRQLPTWEELVVEVESEAQQVQEHFDEVYAEFEAHVSETDREVLKRPDIREWTQASLLEAYRRGVHGDVHEILLLHARPWGFPLNAITVDVHLWHGEADPIVPVEQAHYLAKHIPNCRVHLLPGMGHLIPLQFQGDIFGLFSE